MEIPRLGRKWAMCFAAVLMGLSLFLYATVNTVAGFTGMNLFEYWAQSRTFHLILSFTLRLLALVAGLPSRKRLEISH